MLNVDSAEMIVFCEHFPLPEEEVANSKAAI